VSATYRAIDSQKSARRALEQCSSARRAFFFLITLHKKSQKEMTGDGTPARATDAPHRPSRRKHKKKQKEFRSMTTAATVEPTFDKNKSYYQERRKAPSFRAGI
jgi:hypothetical protein